MILIFCTTDIYFLNIKCMTLDKIKHIRDYLTIY